MRLRTDWKGPIASRKVCEIKKKNTRKLLKETAVTEKMEVIRTADVCRKLKWRWFQMTRGRSNKAWEVDWRKNCKSCKHLPFIQFYLNPRELGLSEVSVRNFKQYYNTGLDYSKYFLQCPILHREQYLLTLKSLCISNHCVQKECTTIYPHTHPFLCHWNATILEETIQLFDRRHTIFCSKSSARTLEIETRALLGPLLCKYLYFERASIHLAEMRNTVS